MEHNKIREDYHQIFKMIQKYCPPKEPEKSKLGGKATEYSNIHILTLGCLQTLYGLPAQGTFLKMVAEATQFKCPSQGYFSRRARGLNSFLVNVQPMIFTKFNANQSISTYIMDSMPIEKKRLIKKGQKLQKRSKATTGYVSSLKTHFYGFKLHSILTKSGIPVRIKLLPANIHDNTGFKTIKQHFHDCSIIADKGYVDYSHTQELLEKQNVKMKLPTKKNAKNHDRNLIQTPSENRSRAKIETYHSVLESMGAKQPRRRDDLGITNTVRLCVLTFTLVQLSKGRRGTKSSLSLKFGG